MLRHRGTYVQSFRSEGLIVTEEFKSKTIVARIIRITRHRIYDRA